LGAGREIERKGEKVDVDEDDELSAPAMLCFLYLTRSIESLHKYGALESMGAQE
jgi:hypothetical protein